VGGTAGADITFAQVGFGQQSKNRISCLSLAGWRKRIRKSMPEFFSVALRRNMLE
jgi:hypothetical protein